MEGLLNLVSIIIIVFGILQIILFFKLWGMTNDIKDIKNKYLGVSLSQPYKSTDDLSKNTALRIGMVVENIKTGKRMTIKEIKNGNYVCSCADGYNISYLNFDKSEIRPSTPS